MISLSSILTLLTFSQVAADTKDAEFKPTVIVVVGAQGTEEYGKEFAIWADRWQSAAKRADTHLIAIGMTSDQESSDREQIQQALQAANLNSSEIWFILIGHGTFDGRQAKFNLRGPDVTATEFSEWLTRVKKPVAVINCASASGPFVNKLSASNRVVISATKSGFEQNYARFGDYISKSISDPDSDLDKDGQTSLLEAWLMASMKTEEFYKTEGRIETEHSLLDDNGDQHGTRPDAFRGVRPMKKKAAGKSLDGFRANQWYLIRSETERKMPIELRAVRDELELAVIHLRDQKSEFSEEEYFTKLESLLVQIAEVYEQVEKNQKSPTVASPIRLVGFEDPPPPPMPTFIESRGLLLEKQR